MFWIISPRILRSYEGLLTSGQPTTAPDTTKHFQLDCTACNYAQYVNIQSPLVEYISTQKYTPALNVSLQTSGNRQTCQFRINYIVEMPRVRVYIRQNVNDQSFREHRFRLHSQVILLMKYATYFLGYQNVNEKMTTLLDGRSKRIRYLIHQYGTITIIKC